MTVRTLIAALYILFLAANPAYADPFSIGATVVTGILGISASAAVLTTVGTLLLAGANFALQTALAPDSPGFDPGEFKNTFIASDGPEIRAVGRARIKGARFFGNTSGFRTFRGQLICKGPIDGIEAYYVGGREVVINQETGAAESPPWSTATTTYLYIKSKIGDGTELAWEELKEAFPDLWTDNHRVRGVGQLLIEFFSPGVSSSRFLRLYGSPGVRDDVEVLGRWSLVFDPRDNGYRWTENGILNAAHMLAGFPSTKSYDSTYTTATGFQLDLDSVELSDIDWDDIAIQADKADELVDTLTGQEPRARASGVWGAAGASRLEVMTSMLTSIGADIYETDEGKISIRLLEANPEIDILFEARHLHDEQVSIKYGREGVERPNTLVLKYYSPEREYEMTEVPLRREDGTRLEWSYVQSEIDAYGIQEFPVDLPFCTSASQAQRIGYRLFALARANAGSAMFNMSGLATWGHRVISINFPDHPQLQEGNKLHIEPPRPDFENGTVEVQFIVDPQNPDYDPQLHEGIAPDNLPEQQFESDLDQPAVPSEYALVKYIGGAHELRLGYAGVTGASGSEANYRTFADGINNPWQSMEEDGTDYASEQTGNIVGENIEFRVRMFNSSDEVSYFSDHLVVENIQISNTAP